MPGDPVEDLLRDTTDDTADPVASLLADTAGPAMVASAPVKFEEGKPAPGASAAWGTGIKAVGQETQTPSSVQYESPDAYRERITRDNLPAAVAMETAKRVGGAIAGATVDPIRQGIEKRTALGTLGGIARGGFGAGLLTTPVGAAFLSSGMASEAAHEAEAAGEDVPAITKGGAAISRAFEGANAALPDFEKMRLESRRLGMPVAEAMSEVGQLANEALPIAVLGGAHEMAPRAIKGIGRAIYPARTLPVPEGGLPPVRGTPDARPLPPPDLAGLRPAQVEGSPLPPIPERPLPPAVSGETAPVGSSIEAAKNLRPKTPQVSATLEGQTVRAKPPRIIGGGTRTIGRATPEDLAARVLAKREAAPTTEVTPVRPAVPPEGPAAARPVEAVPAEAAPREAPASPPRQVAEPEAPPARMPVAEAPVAEGVAPGGAGQAPRKVTPVAKNRFILQERGVDGMWRKSGEAKTAAEAQAWEKREPASAPDELSTAPDEVVKPTQPEPAQAPAVSEKVPTISDKGGAAAAPIAGRHAVRQSMQQEAHARVRKMSPSELARAMADDADGYIAEQRGDFYGDDTQPRAPVRTADRVALEAEALRRYFDQSGRMRDESASWDREAKTLDRPSGYAGSPVGYAKGALRRFGRFINTEDPNVPRDVHDATIAAAKKWMESETSSSAPKTPKIAQTEPLAAPAFEKSGVSTAEAPVAVKTPEPPLVAKMRAEPDAEARAAIWRDTVQRGDRNAIGEAESWARKAQKARGEKDGLIVGREAVERELNPPKPKKIGGGRAKGGKQSGELDPLAAPQALSDIYDLADRGARSIVRGVGGMVAEIPGVRKVIGKASEVYDKNFKSEAAQVGPEYASETASRRGAQNLGREEGRRAASEIDDAIGSLPEDAQEGVYRYMNSEADTLPPAAAKHQKIIDNVSAQIKDMGQQMVDRGILSQEAFDQYQRFLMRRYRAKQGSPFKSIGDGTRARVERNYVREDAPGVYFEAKKGYPEIEAIAKKHDGYALTYKGDQGAVKFKTPEARDAFVAELDEVLGGTRKRLGENATKEIRKGNVLDAKQAMEARSDVPRRSDLVEKFDPLPGEVRAALGEITDPTRAVLDTLIKGKLKIADHDFLAGLEGKGDGKGAWTAAEKTPGYEKMTQDWAGPLRNKWVRADVAADLIGTFQSADVPGFTRGWLNQWKANKTVWSPRTAMRQWFGNPMFMHFAGVNPANPINYQAMFKAIKSLRRDSGLRTELVREGVIGPHDFANIELQSMPDAPTNVRYKAGQAAANPLMLFKFGEKAQQGLGKFYGASDAFTRATIYWKMRENGMSPRQAAAEVRRWTPNYDDSGALVKKLRTSVIGSPFATYKFETYRIIGEALKDHPVRLATGLSFIYGAQKALDMMGADTVTDAERKAIAENFGMQEMILGRDDEGRPLTFGAKYINPIGGIEKSPDRIGEDGTLEYLASLAGVEQSPLVDTISTLSRGEDRSGRPVFDGPMPTTMEKLIGGAKAYGRQVAPSLTPGLGANAAQIAAATQGKQLSEKIPKQSALQAWISGLLGVDIRPADFDLMQNNMQRRAIGLASGEKSNARKKMSQGDEGAEAQAVGKIADLENEYNERIDVVDKASQAQRKAAK